MLSLGTLCKTNVYLFLKFGRPGLNNTFNPSKAWAIEGVSRSTWSRGLRGGATPWQPGRVLAFWCAHRVSGLQEVGSSHTEGGVDKTETSAGMVLGKHLWIQCEPKPWELDYILRVSKRPK